MIPIILFAVTFGGALCDLNSDARDVRNRVTKLHAVYGCRPRPELVYLNGTEPSTVLIPDVAVLHRCGGYCFSSPSQGRSSCRSTTSDLIDLVFAKKNYITSQLTYERFKMTNETQCICHF